VELRSKKNAAVSQEPSSGSVRSTEDMVSQLLVFMQLAGCCLSDSRVTQAGVH